MQAICPTPLAAILPFLVFSFVLHSVRSCVLMPNPGVSSCSLPTMSCMLVTGMFSGLLLPGMLRLFHEGRRLLPGLPGVVRILPMVVVYLLPASLLLFDNDGWMHNRTLCLMLCMSYGFMIAGALLVMYGSVPARQRAWWLGISCGTGVLGARLLSYIFNQYAADLGMARQITFAAQTGLNFLLAGLLFIALTLRPAHSHQPYFLKPFDDQRRRPACKVYLILAFITLVIMNGFLGSLLMPIFTPRTPFSWWPLTFAVVCPLVGRLVDRNPDLLAPRIFVWCGAFFLMAPSLNVIGADTWLFAALHTFCSLCQTLIFIVMAVTLAGLVGSAGAAAAYTAFLFGVRILSPYFERLLDLFPMLTDGTKVLTTTVLAGLYFFLIHRAWFVDNRAAGDTAALSGPTPIYQTRRLLFTEALAKPTPGAMSLMPAPTGPAPLLAPHPGGEGESEGEGEGEVGSDREGESESERELVHASEIDPDLADPALASDPAWPLTSVNMPLAFTHYLDSAALTPREREIANELLVGRTTRGISQNLGISENTVNYHVKNILDKFNVGSRYAFLARFINSREEA